MDEQITPEELEAHKERLRARLDEMQRDPGRMQKENAMMAKFAARRIRQGKDSLGKLQVRVSAICADPESEEHTKWNAQNLLEQVEALLAKDSSPLPPSRLLNREQAIEIMDAFRSGDKERIEAIRSEYEVEAALEAKE